MAWASWDGDKRSPLARGPLPAWWPGVSCAAAPYSSRGGQPFPAWRLLAASSCPLLRPVQRPIFCQDDATKGGGAGAGKDGGAGAGPPRGDPDIVESPFNEGPLRYAPYIARMKMLLIKTKLMVIKGSRYVAYSSDVGESLRPVMKPWMVNATYGIAGVYIVGDTVYSGYGKHQAGHSQEVVVATCAHTAVFQGLASLVLPAVIIHTVVHQTQHALEKPSFAKMPRVVKWGPSVVGLVLIPFLPLIDPPVEYVCDALFDKAWPAWRVGHVHHH